MKSFIWHADFETGLPAVDAQHQRLVLLINDFGDRVTNQAGLRVEEIDEMFGHLEDYARVHFTDEENIMTEVGLSAAFVTFHKQLHSDFLRQIRDFHHALLPGDREGPHRLLMFLVHWLAYHILGIDKMFAKQVTLVQSGTDPEQAYEATRRRVMDTAMEPLLRAMNGLFVEVSKRNRELAELNQALEAKVQARTAALNDANKRLQELANTDLLTGLPNRRYAVAHLSEAWQKALATDRPLSCLLLDADRFKAINDTHGHDAGDAVIRAFGQQLRNCLRTDDFVARMGGDEFLVVLPHTDLDGATQVAHHIRNQISALRIPAGTGVWEGSVSIGVAACCRDMADYNALIKAADRGLYQAKERGRNGVGVVTDSAERIA